MTGGELRALRTEARRTHAEYRLAQPGKFVTAVVGRLSEVGLRQTGEQALRAFSTSRSRSMAVAQMRAAEQILRLLRRALRPVPVSVPGARGGRGERAGRPQPARPRLPPGAAGRAARAGHGGGSGELLGPAPTSSSPTSWRTSGLGRASAPAGYRERWLSEAWAQYAAALWVRQRQGESAFRDMMDTHGALGHAPRRGGADPPRAAARSARGGRAPLSRHRLRQGRVGAPHAARHRRRRRLLRWERAPSSNATASRRS